ncbi:hypothetical protein [Streptomyces fulvorobeus]|uniref:Uncharacterized protein n=1 Tax=Streptomyces fulvorobeus TaxID=284028 RepID=A0A7J0CCX8_9ACTN|nr:hypothetical protein [Streptomyces fulvorobeus]NYE43879.1 hypothetical protein [Streptomyces fulvorobeus]GFN00371.1 hypothetical protein Sfulv_51810 [Streptomyces fulvorobeus]
MRSRTQRFAAVCAVLAVTLGTAAVGSAAAAEAGAAAVACPRGYVCLLPQFGSGQPVLVKEGDTAKFSPALTVAEVTNATSVTYCVIGSLSYPLGPGRTQTGVGQVNAVGPSQSGYCLL